jgi:tripartite-type tricarboxylate transporter receptor subunit TctC
MPGTLLLRALCAGMIVTLAFATDATAQSEFPSRTVRIIVPIPAGAAADTLPRIVAERLTAKWGQPVIIENRVGGALNIGAEAASRAEPDGHTLFATPPPPLSVNQNLYAKLNYDPATFVPVTVMASLPNVLMVHPSVPASSLKELIAHAKANPGKLTYGSAGAGSTPHLTMELLNSLAGIKTVHVPYKGLAPALSDLYAGHISMMFDNLGNAINPVRDGKLKGLAIGTLKRIAALPNVPTLAETFPGVESETWFAIVAPPKTPPALAERISKDIRDVLNEPEVAKRIQAMSLTIVGNTPKETAGFIVEERERWRKVIQEAGVKLN